MFIGASEGNFKFFLFFYFKAQTFAQVVESNTDSSEEKAITSLGILNTMETILNVMEDQKEVRM